MKSSNIINPRITSGFLKGRRIVVPKVENIRVPQDILKQAVFSILGEKVKEAEVLDIFAGSGSFGLEALSRGANHIDFVEKDIVALDSLKKTLFSLKIEDKCDLFHEEAIRYIGNTGKSYDLIFADPFFEDLRHRFLFQNLAEILSPNGTIIFSHGKKLSIKDQISGTNLKLIETRRYGAAYVSFITN